MTNLYSLLEISIGETLNSKQSTKNVDFIFDLAVGNQKITDVEFDKNNVFACLNNAKQSKLKNYTKDARVVVQYFGEIYE